MFKKIVLPLGFLAAALAGVWLAYRAGHPMQAYLFHSDSLYLPTLFHDLFSGGRLSDWYLTPAPYFFPDFPLYLLAYLAGSGPYEQILAFALLQTALTGAALFFVASAVLPRQRIATTVLTTVVLIWFGLSPVEPFVELFTSAYHFGAFVSALGFVALWLRWDRGGDARTIRFALAGMCALAFLTSLSDNIFLVQAVAPFVVTAVLLRAPAQAVAKPRVAAVLAVLAAGLLGSMSYKLVVAHKTRYATSLGLAQFEANAQQLLDLFGRLFVQIPLFGVLFCVYVLFGSACLVAVLRRRGIFGLPRPLLLLVVFSMVSMGGTLAALLLAKNLVVSPRYLIPLAMWPIIIGLLLVQHFLKGRLYWANVYGSALVAFAVLAGAWRLEAGEASRSRYYPEQIACLDNALAGTGLTNGIAQYWDAKHIQAFSRHPLTLAQYVSDLNEHKWITSERFFRPSYDFAIIAEDADAMYKLPAATLAALNGSPAKTVSCGSRTLLVYGKDGLRLKKIAAAGHSYRWRGCELPTLIGKPNAGCEMEKSDPGQDGYLTFGPYEMLAAGNYAYEVEYVSSKPAAEVAGEWDVALALPTEAKRLQAGTLAGTGGQVRILSGRFTVPAQHDQSKIEIRHLANKGGMMKVISLRLTRLD